MIETDRLQLIPLQPHQLQMYMVGDTALEKELGVSIADHNISPALFELLEHGIIPAVNNPKNDPLYFTFWLIVLKDNGLAIGDICFKGEYEEKNDVEIGYGIYPLHQKKGYMTEAIRGVIDWAKQQPIKVLIAETETSNIGSLKILTNSRFTIYKNKGETTWLRLELSKNGGKDV